MSRSITWGVDGHGRAFLVDRNDFSKIIACCPKAGHALFVSLEIEDEIKKEQDECSSN